MAQALWLFSIIIYNFIIKFVNHNVNLANQTKNGIAHLAWSNESLPKQHVFVKNNILMNIL